MHPRDRRFKEQNYANGWYAYLQLLGNVDGVGLRDIVSVLS